MRKIIGILTLLVIFAAFTAGNVLATPSTGNSDVQLPDAPGIYKVPGRPELMLRVFVREPGKPQSDPNASACTPNNDANSEAIVNPAGWHLPANWNYSLNLSSVPASVGAGNLGTIAGDGFSTWEGAVSNAVTFHRGSDTTKIRAQLDGANIVAWGRTSGTALATTYTWYYTANNEVAEVDTIMNKKFSWSWTPFTANACVPLGTYDAQDILTHEQGHWMGLDDEYATNYVNNTMYGYGSKGEIKKDTLTTGDIQGVSVLY